MTTLTPEEQRAVRAMGGWAVLDLLIRPDAGWPGAEAGGSSVARGWPDGHHYEYSRNALRVLAPSPDFGAVAVEVKWAKVGRYAERLSAGLVERIRSHRLEAREHQSTYPSPYPGIGRPYCWDTSECTGAECGQCARDRIDLAAANERAQRDREAWYVESARLRDVERSLLDEAFPLADAPAEPTFLDLMGAS